MMAWGLLHPTTPAGVTSHGDTSMSHLTNNGALVLSLVLGASHLLLAMPWCWTGGSAVETAIKHE